MRFARALLAFLLLPGVVGGVVPLLILPMSPGTLCSVGCFVMGAGAAIVGWTVRDFYVIGKGTLAPWDPPRRLVVVGLFRVVRNPMYVGVLIWLAGWSLHRHSWPLALYTLAVAMGFHLRVLHYEEPILERQFSDEFRRYAATVPRWLPFTSSTRP